VFVTVEPGKQAVIALTDPNNGSAKSYSLWKDQGRVAFPSPDSAAPFTPGVYYAVTATAGLVTVDLTTPV
jgi:hypothetical protein